MDASILPSYSPSGLPPSYSAAPDEGEESLSYNQRVLGAHAHGTFTKKCGSVSVILTEQEDDAQIPVYTQRGVVSGTVHVDSCHHISEIVLKVRSVRHYLNAQSIDNGSKQHSSEGDSGLA